MKLILLTLIFASTSIFALGDQPVDSAPQEATNAVSNTAQPSVAITLSTILTANSQCINLNNYCLFRSSSFDYTNESGFESNLGYVYKMYYEGNNFEAEFSSIDMAVSKLSTLDRILNAPSGILQNYDVPKLQSVKYVRTGIEILRDNLTITGNSNVIIKNENELNYIRYNVRNSSSQVREVHFVWISSHESVFGHTVYRMNTVALISRNTTLYSFNNFVEKEENEVQGLLRKYHAGYPSIF